MRALEKIISDRLYRFHYLLGEAGPMLPPPGKHGMSDLVDELLPLIQAKTLYMLCMLHNSTLYITRRAAFERAELVQWYSYLNLVPASLGVATSITSDADVQLWIKGQSQLRTGMMI